jgi:spermidine synthase
MTDFSQSLSSKKIKIEEKNDTQVIEIILKEVHQYLEGMSSAEELYTNMHGISHARLMMKFPKKILKAVVTHN